MYEVRSDFVILRTKFAKTVVPHNFVMHVLSLSIWPGMVCGYFRLIFFRDPPFVLHGLVQSDSLDNHLETTSVNTSFEGSHIKH